MTKISVIIPAYLRPKELSRCVKGLKEQKRPADEVIIVIRDGDKSSKEIFEQNKNSLNLKKVIVGCTGQVFALNAGLAKAKGDIIAITDDDCIPRKDWLQRIEAHFTCDSKVGGVGGKDFLYLNNKLIDGKKSVVGKVNWLGMLVGNHHIGFGHARQVDHLKGANMAFRKDAIKGIKFDSRLNGKGAQVYNDAAFCFAVKKKGWKLIYDPKVRVDHYMGMRHEENKRGNFNWTAVEEGAYNHAFVLSNYISGPRLACYLLYSLILGDKFLPGIIMCARIFPREKKNAFLRMFAALKGRFEGIKAGKYQKIR